MKNRKEIIVYLLLLFIIIFGIYYNSLNSALIWDSRLQIEKNSLIVNNSSIFKAFKYGFWEPMGYNLGRNDYYRPLTIASLILNKKILGDSNVSFKIVNLFLFYFILIILYFYFKSQLEQKYFAEIAVVVFAVFPLHIDNVVWVVGRCDLFLLLWGILSIYFLDRFITKDDRKNLVFATLFFLLALFSKESSVFFLPFFFFYELLKRRKITILYHIINLLSVLLLFFIKFQVNGFGGEKFHLFYPFIKNIYVFFGTIGYYFKSMILPFDFTMFSFIDNITNFHYIIWGIVSFCILIYLLYFSFKKDSSLKIPLLFVGIFLPFYIIFAYSNLYPYSISTRYIIVPFIGILWIGVKYFLKIKTNIKYFILILILSSFSLSTVYNSLYYENSELFWEKIYNREKNVPFIAAVYAKSLFKKRDLIKGEFVLKNALNYKMRNYTAVFIGVMYAKLEYSKANYNESLLWLKRIKRLKIDNLNKILYYETKADIALSKGNFDKSEKIIKEAIKELGSVKELYYKLLYLYIGYEKWDKAQKIVKKHPDIFRGNNIISIKQGFYSLTPLQKLDFFIKHKNYKSAIAVFKKLNRSSLKEQFKLAELLYRSGDEKQGKELIKSILLKNNKRYKILNSIGYFYLKRLSRGKEALKYFKLSLSLNANQPQLKKIVNYLETLK